MRQFYQPLLRESANVSGLLWVLFVYGLTALFLTYPTNVAQFVGTTIGAYIIGSVSGSIFWKTLTKEPWMMFKVLTMILYLGTAPLVYLFGLSGLLLLETQAFSKVPALLRDWLLYPLVFGVGGSLLPVCLLLFLQLLFFLIHLVFANMRKRLKK